MFIVSEYATLWTLLFVTLFHRESLAALHDDRNETYQTDFWSMTDITKLPDNWQYLRLANPAQTIGMYYDYKHQPVLQSYPGEPLIYRRNVIGLHLQLKSLDNMWTDFGVITRESNQFRYGEFEWIAKIIPSENVLTVFRMNKGPYPWKSTAQPDVLAEQLDNPAIQLSVEWKTSGPAVFRSSAFYPSEFAAGLQDSPDVSGGTPTGWTNPVGVCVICREDLSTAFYTYKLLWTENELVWSINNTEIHRLVDPRKIPRVKLHMAAYLVHDGIATRTAKMRTGSMTLYSVLARRIAEEEFFHSAFRDKMVFPGSLWRIMEGPASDTVNIRPDVEPAYSPGCVRVENGSLALYLGLNRTNPEKKFYTTARVDGSKRGLYGDIEWRARLVNPLQNATYWLQLVLNPCDMALFRYNGSPPCKISFGPSVNFKFHNRNEMATYYYHYKDEERQSGLEPYYRQLNVLPYLPKNVPSDLTNFHTYRIHWTQDMLEWYMDDNLLDSTVEPSLVPKRPMYVSMQTRVQDIVASWPNISGINAAYSLIPGMEIEYIKWTRQLDTSRTTTIASTPSRTTTKEPVVQPVAEGRPSQDAGNDTYIVLAWSPSGLVVLAVAGFLFVVFRRHFAMRGSMRPQSAGIQLDLAVLLSSLPTDDRRARLMRFMEVPSEAIVISTEILGKGAYGIVFRGSAKHLPTIAKGPVDVAIKCLTNLTDRDKFMEEFQVMMNAGCHVNIVKLLGIVLGDMQLLILEYCQNGSLLPYLRQFNPSNMYLHIDQMENPHRDFRDFSYLSSRPNVSITTSGLIKFAHQISRGMEYLAAKSIIHRDLAARNVLVTGNGVVKIADFGLARYGQEEYMMSDKRSALLPVLWMSPEAIQTGTFSQKSDVWSFGVVLWEIFSLGQSPFDTSDVTKFSADSFAAWLLAGHQMAAPTGTPAKIYAMMKDCWSIDADDRPLFANLQTQLMDILTIATNSDGYLPLVDPNDLSSAYKKLLDDAEQPSDTDTCQIQTTTL